MQHQLNLAEVKALNETLDSLANSKMPDSSQIRTPYEPDENYRSTGVNPMAKDESTSSFNTQTVITSKPVESTLPQ